MMCRNDDVEEKNTIISTQKLHEEASPINPISKAFFVIPSYEHKENSAHPQRRSQEVIFSIIRGGQPY